MRGSKKTIKRKIKITNKDQSGLVWDELATWPEGVDGAGLLGDLRDVILDSG